MDKRLKDIIIKSKINKSIKKLQIKEKEKKVVLSEIPKLLKPDIKAFSIFSISNEAYITGSKLNTF